MDLDGDKTFYTETMARLLAGQGKYDRAAEVYRYLLERTPHRRDLEQELSEVLCAVAEPVVSWESVRGLIERWVTMLLRRRTLEQLQKLSMPESAANRAARHK